MLAKRIVYLLHAFAVCGAALLLAACNLTKHVANGDYLLRKNTIALKHKGVMLNKGEVKDNLARIVVQKTNTYRINGLFPYQLWTYNLRYKTLHDKPDSLLPKSKERPVIYDTSTVAKTVQNMKSYLFNTGYFYANVKDTVSYKGKMAYQSYIVYTGDNYLINRITYNIKDSATAMLVMADSANTILSRNKPFTFSMTELERSRLTKLMRSKGYYYFSLDDIRFVIDTLDKAFLRNIDNPLENALNFIAANRRVKRPTIDIEVNVSATSEKTSIPYKVGKVTIYPDYEGSADLADSALHVDTSHGVELRYHMHYVNAKVVASRVFLKTGKLFSQDDYDNTVVKLNELGIFQFIRIQLTDNGDSTLACTVFLNKTKKFDFSTNYEISSGTTYQLGNSAGISFRNKNFARGANLMALSLNGGLELTYNDNKGNTIPEHFSLITQYYGLNASLDFPKFLAPINTRFFTNNNLPRTIISAGSNVMNRVQYFTLVNTTAAFKYNWRQNARTTWEVAPAFLNIIRLPRISESFREKLVNNAFLRNSYKENYIEGQNVTFTYNSAQDNSARTFTRCKVSAEEAGALLSGVEGLSNSFNDVFTIAFAQYARFDVDFQRFYSLAQSTAAFRFYGGFGLPYGSSPTLPYVKQYFVGGPFSLRGWRIRSLGPGSYYDSTNVNKLNTLDRTGDIKLEANGEYRFPIAPLFAGMVKMNGAIFADAGNIWLAKRDSNFAGGEFEIDKLGRDIAVDVGVGSRFEIASFLTFRVDAAFPIKKPYEPNNNGWVLRSVQFDNPTWRANNLIVNISIGYPF